MTHDRAILLLFAFFLIAPVASAIVVINYDVLKAIFLEYQLVVGYGSVGGSLYGIYRGVKNMMTTGRII